MGAESSRADAASAAVLEKRREITRMDQAVRWKLQRIVEAESNYDFILEVVFEEEYNTTWKLSFVVKEVQGKHVYGEDFRGYPL